MLRGMQGLRRLEHRQRIRRSESYPVCNHPLGILNPSSPRLHKCSELGALHNSMVRAPAHSNLQPPLSLLTPVHVPNPLGTSNRNDRNSAARHQDWTSEIAIANSTDVGHGDRSPSLWHLSRGKTRWHLPAKVGDVFECRRQRIDRLRGDIPYCGGIETCRSRQGD